ncbi:HIT family protein [Aerococcus sp. L_32]|uniref:HIT family protein n=1 Tax=Aerococcus sp. L_32 TaxID=3422316 RepID=UPI003AC278E0
MTEHYLDPECGYCQAQSHPEEKHVGDFAYLVGELANSVVVVFNEQSHPGRVIVAHKKHVSEMVDLTDAERNDYFAEVNQVAKALHKLFNPDKINYGAYGDGGSHLHFHLVPKYEGEVEWGTPFAMNPGETFLTDDAAYEKIAADLRAELGL